MFEIARYLEQMAVRFNPLVLIGPGLAAVLLGLFVWLGGLGFRRALIAVLGAVSGGVCGFFITAGSSLVTMISAGITTVIAMIFEKIFITILAAVLAAVIGFAVLAGPYIESEGAATSISRDETQNRAEFSIQQSVKVARGCMADFVTETKQIFLDMPVRNWAIIAALVVVFIVAGFYLWRLTSAFCCAALGATLIFTGMILLLLYKGAAPISRILQNQLFYMSVFAAMTIFGMTEQLLLCPHIKGKSARKKKTDNAEKGPEKTTDAWRTS